MMKVQKLIEFPIVSRVATNHNCNTYEFPNTKQYYVNNSCCLPVQVTLTVYLIGVQC